MEQLFIKAVEYLKRYPLKNLATLKHLSLYKNKLDLSILNNRFHITRGNSYVSYSCSSIINSFPPETVQESHVLTDEAVALISRNGYTLQELKKYFENGSVWFGYIESGEIKSICFMYQNHENIWEIAGVHTVEAERKKGFGRIVVLSALRYLLAKGLIPRYEVDIKNIASINLAEGLGMKQFLKIDHFLLHL